MMKLWTAIGLVPEIVVLLVLPVIVSWRRLRLVGQDVWLNWTWNKTWSFSKWLTSLLTMCPTSLNEIIKKSWNSFVDRSSRNRSFPNSKSLSLSNQRASDLKVWKFTKVYKPCRKRLVTCSRAPPKGLSRYCLRQSIPEKIYIPTAWKIEYCTLSRDKIEYQKTQGLAPTR